MPTLDDGGADRLVKRDDQREDGRAEDALMDLRQLHLEKGMPAAGARHVRGLEINLVEVRHHGEDDQEGKRQGPKHLNRGDSEKRRFDAENLKKEAGREAHGDAGYKQGQEHDRDDQARDAPDPDRLGGKQREQGRDQGDQHACGERGLKRAHQALVLEDRGVVRERAGRGGAFEGVDGGRDERRVKEQEHEAETCPDQGGRHARGGNRVRHQARPTILPSSRRTSKRRYQPIRSASISPIATEEIAAASG